MSRPLRIEFPNAGYHVTSRGDRREAIFEDDVDRQHFLAVLAAATQRFDVAVFAYCLMDNHYHLVIQTRLANLSQLMRQINGVYTQQYNRRHDKVGHLFQGRFKAILVDQDAYLLEVIRYVDLNPVRARLVRDPANWRWSSYAAHIGNVVSAEWLDSVTVHSNMLGRDARTTADRRKAMSLYAAFVAAGKGIKLWDSALTQQMYLGDKQFIERMQAAIDPARARSKDIPKRHRQTSPKPISHYLNANQDRNVGIVAAVCEGRYSVTAVAKEAGLSVSWVSRIVNGTKAI